MSDEHPPFRYVMEPRGDYLYVKVSGRMRDRQDMLAYQHAIEQAMTPELGRRAIVDGRDSERPPIDLRAEMWTWMSETPALRRIAIVANEEKTTKRVARSADINRLLIQGFHSLEEAEAWVRRGGE